MRIIALDVGEKRIGVARADSDTRIAVPVGYIVVDGSEWQEIAKISRLQGSVFFVIGLPRSNEGNETKQSVYVRNFARILTEKMPGSRVRFQDESLTSVEAEERLRQRKKRYEKGEIDAEAAAIILQDFIEGFNVKENNVQPTEFETKKPEKKKKMKTGFKIVFLLLLVGAIAGAATWGVNWYLDREEQKRAYAEYVAEQEAKKAEVFTFMIRPGETIYEVRDNLIKIGYTATEVDAALTADYDFDFLKERPGGATLEGYLYGETHEFYKDAPATDVIKTFLSGMNNVIIENSLEARYAEQGLTLHEGITLASIVQSETGALTSEMPTVASVFLNRMEIGLPLGSDVTVSYALDTVDPNRSVYVDNQSALTVDSCYNTRLYAGLPCGPISNPGLAALLAVAAPSDTAYLYFLTGDDDMMYYSSTEFGHNQNIRDHCQNKCNIAL